MAKRKWEKSTHKLGENHKWRSKPGYNIFVANWGAVRFDIPSDWVVVPGETFKFHDRQPPDDECIIELTVNTLPPADYTGFPLAAALADVLDGTHPNTISRSDVAYEERGGTRLAWSTVRYVDESVLREAIAQNLLGLHGVIQILLTMAYWPEDAERIEPVWEEILRSVRLGEAVDMSGRKQPPIIPKGYG